MTRHEAVQAYLTGRIDRREFVRRLTVAGVSTAAALTYAHSLTSSASAAPASRGTHGLTASFDHYAGHDSDGDGCTDDEEEKYGTDPHDVDTDDDGISDCDEIDNGTDPLDPNDPGDDDDDDDGSPTLPNTGTGTTESRTGLIGTLAAAGAGAALIGRRLRRVDAEV